MKTKIPLFCLFTAILILGFRNDNNPIKAITEKLDQFRKEFPQEKVHLHFDKPVYSIGDTMYFKGYIVNAEKNMPSTISNILYVDITNENKLKQHKTILLPIADGVCEGSMVVSDTLQSGNYQVRAYTNWMRNFDEVYFYHREFTIGNALNDEVQMHAAFKADSADESKLLAEIKYSTINNHSFNNKEVRYAIMKDGKEVQKGKTELNENGTFKIDLSKLLKNSAYQLTTNLKEDRKTEVMRSVDFSLPAASHSFHFFPEGGQMINGFQSRIGFKAVGLHGEGLDVSGIVKDETGNQVADFASSFSGMGSFIFSPEVNHEYTALLKYKNGLQEKMVLPKAENEGCELSLENDKNQLINLTVSTKGQGDNHLTLITQCNNRIQYTHTLELINNTLTEQISTKKFPTGIIQFTIFDAALKPLAERLVFVNHSDQLKINLSDVKKTYSTREKEKLTFLVKDEEGNPVAGNFSVAVTNSNIFPDDKNSAPTIVSDLLLTADLRGFIENPNYYFENIGKKTIQDLDNLMLTQGWRRFKWQQVLTGQYAETKFVVEKDLQLSGRILTKKKMPAAGAMVNIISKGGAGFTLATKTDANGDFLFDNVDFTGDIPVVVQAMTADSNRDVIIEMNQHSSPPNMFDSYLNNDGIYAGEGTKNYLEQSHLQFDEWRKSGRIPKNTTVLEEVKVIANPRRTEEMEAVQGSYNLNGPGHADQIFTYDDLRNYTNLATFLPGRAMGILVKTYIDPKYRGNFDQHPTLQAFSTRGTGGPMRIVLDGQPMEVTSFPLDAISINSIQSIEVLRSGSFTNVYGLDGSNGVIIITSKRGGIDYDHQEEKKLAEPAKGMLITNVQGYSEIREFYTPEHTDKEMNNSLRDLRSTLYWKSFVKTDVDGKGTIEFYNGDVSGKYSIIIEGFTEDGQLGSETFSYKLK